MNKTYIESNGVRLNTYDDFGVSLNYQIEDILDITKRSTSFSKTITLPGTPTNNQFFYNIFDINIDNFQFNPVLSIPASIRVEDNIVMQGNLQLLNIINLNNEITYEVVVRGELGNILSNMSDYSLTNLDLSEYNHVRNQDNIYQSWFYNIREYGALTNYGSGGKGYVYPHIVNNFDTNGSSEMMSSVYIYDSFPAVYVKTIIDKVFDFSKYTYSSKFFESEYFNKLIIPYTGDKIQLADEDVVERTTIVGVAGSSYTVGLTLYNGLPEYAGGPVTGYVALTDKLGRGTDWYKNNTYNYYMPLKRELGTVGGIEYSDDLSTWGEYSGYVAPFNGYYDVDMDLKLIPKYIQDSGISFKYTGNGVLTYYYKIRMIKTNGSIVDLYSSTVPIDFSPSDNTTHTSPWYDLNGALPMNGNANNVWMNVGDKIVILFGVRYPSTNNTWNGSSVTNNSVKLRMVVKESLNGSPSYLKVEPSSNVDMGNTMINMNQILPNIKMKDFFLDIVKMFNLVVQDNPNKKGDLIIEPRDEFYRTKQKVLDWSPIIDNDNEIIITPMSELDARSYVFTYKEDNDYFNEQYTLETNEIYGELKIDVSNDFSVSEKKLELLFSPTPDANLYSTGGVAPYFATSDMGTIFKPKKVKPRILFYGGLIPVTNNAYIIRDFVGQPLSNSTISSLVPYCGMFDHPTTPNYDLAFGRVKKLYWNTNQIPVNNLYEQFHKATFENIIDINSRLLEAKFYLTPKDIAEFDFRDIIFLNGQYWRVNKIQDYNPAGADNLTTVILYKIVDMDFFEGGQISLPTSNKPCPIDISIRITSKGNYYVSDSGLFISEDCCKSIGGVFSTSGCKVRRKVNPLNPAKPILFKAGGNNVVAISDKYGPSDINNRNNTSKSPATLLVGGGNYINEDVGNSMIVGNNSTITTGTTNTIVIGDGITADSSDALFIGDIKLDGNGAITRLGLLITDGGEDVVYPFEKVNQVDVIDGTWDSVRNPGGFQLRTRNTIDGDNPE